MDQFQSTLIVVLTLLAAVVGLSAFSARTRIPSPTLMILAGLVVALLPGQMHIALKPELVLMIFMPPILYGAAWDTTWHDFWRNIRPISLLAVGLVFATTAAVALVAKALIPGMPWAVAFVLGAIVSPPDAAAATAVCSKLRVPKRIITILEGESLVNDASGLIAYKFALAAAMTGVFSWGDAGIELVRAGIGGVAYGIVVGWIMSLIHKQVKDANVATALSLLAPYVAYVPAEAMHVSGVLAAVSAGIVVSWRSPQVLNAEGRLQARPVWEVLILLINGFLFIMLGVQIDPILRGASAYSPGLLVTSCVLISLTAIVIRIAWVFPAAWIPRLLFPHIRRREPTPRSGALAVIAWSGMRGSVSLAAALAIPETISAHGGDTMPFPYRDLVVLLVFAVILSTLVVQGLTLEPMIRKLDMEVGEDVECTTEIEARSRAVLAGYEHLEKLGTPTSNEPEVAARVREQYEKRLEQLKIAALLDRTSTAALETKAGVRARLELIGVERRTIVAMRESGEINDQLFRKLEKELDLDEIRLGQLLD